MADYFPVFLAAAIAILALVNFLAGVLSTNHGRRDLLDSIESMASRIAALEEEDLNKWKKIATLERKLVRRESLIRELYAGAVAIIRQLEEAEIIPIWIVPEVIENWANGTDTASGVNTRTTDLVHMIDRHFNEEELEAMAFELGIDYDNLAGATKMARVTSLVTYFERRGQVDLIVEYCIETRPGVYGWPII